MSQDAADKAHVDKVQATADGERLVEHSTFQPGDRELREVQDGLEVERVAAYRETGYVAAPGVGDYHATRRMAKLTGAALGAGLGNGVADDPAAGIVDQVRTAGQEARQEAGRVRKAAGQGRGAGPANRRGRHEVMQGGTGGLVQGTGEGSGKSSSSTGTDTTDQGMDATVGSAPANPDPGTENTPQDRPKSQAASTGGNETPAKATGATGGTETAGKGGSAKTPPKSGNRAN